MTADHETRRERLAAELAEDRLAAVVVALSPDLVYLTDDYPSHKACGERHLTHYENLNNLKDVVNQRFLFVGLPLRLEPAYGSPIRAAAIVDD